MYRYTMTDAIEQDLCRIELLRERLDNRGALPRRWIGRLRRDLEAESTAASTIMEGVCVTVEEVRRLLAGDPPPGVSETDAALVLGYREAMSYVLRRADEDSFTWHVELVKAIQDRAMGGRFDLGAGRFRSIQVHLSDVRSGDVVYTPPPSEDVPDLVERMANTIRDARDEPVPVVAALAHVMLAGIHPFKDGNGRAARILAALVMFRGGYRAPEFTSLEEWWGAHRADYYQAFHCLGAEWSPSADVTPFIGAHVSAQRTQADALSLRLATEREIWSAIEDVVADLGLELRVANAVWECFSGRLVTNRYYRGIADVGKVTAASDLGRLTSAGLLQTRGAGRVTAYGPTEALYRAVADEAGLPEVLRSAIGVEEMRFPIVLEIADRLKRTDELIAREVGARYGQA